MERNHWPSLALLKKARLAGEEGGELLGISKNQIP
ncbi:hypothetical protein VULLAG_LOCUS6663 [Vulpes lagopus]